MKGFSKYIEALKFNDPRTQLQQHPLVKGATFGVEIEFIAACAPFDDMKPEWLAEALVGTEFEEQFVQTYQYNDPNYKKDEDDFINYIRTNKKVAWQALWTLIENYEFNFDQEGEYMQNMIRYWGTRLSQIVTSAGFRIGFGQSSVGAKWAVGSDGVNSELNLPVIEVRSGIMNAQDIERLSTVLQGMGQLSKQFPNELMARGDTGLHVHVHNANVGSKNGYTDIFSRLAAASVADEDAIWDASTNHDRAFERYANMNRPQDFEVHGKDGEHDSIIMHLNGLRIRKGNATAPSIIVSNKELNNYMSSVLSRNSGINVTSEHPTVEYRYLSSMMVVEDPQKVIQFIRYFIDHTAQMSNKGRIKFENDNMRIVLTKFPQDKIRIDFQNNKDNEEDDLGRSSTYKYPKITKPGLPRTELDKPEEGRGDQPFAQWFKGLDWRGKMLAKQRLRRGQV